VTMQDEIDIGAILCAMAADEVDTMGIIDSCQVIGKRCMSILPQSIKTFPKWSHRMRFTLMMG